MIARPQGVCYTVPSRGKEGAVYRLVIVDDEFEIRHGLSSYFPWEELGFTISGVFADGPSTLDHLAKHPVDVLLTDIRMPLMDGLALIRKTKELSPATVCLILSGHKDFEYAREGMALGVRHFIVKPTKYSQLSEIFSSVREELDERLAAPNKGALPLPGTPADDGETEPLVIQAVKHYVETHLPTASLERAAEAVRLNPNYLSTYFHANTKVMFGDYVAALRMREACRLLTESTMRINEIADAVGYSNPTSFSRAFRMTQGMSPKEWRVRYGLVT